MNVFKLRGQMSFCIIEVIVALNTAKAPKTAHNLSNDQL